VNLAHGSNATATAPLAARVIAETLGGEFAPLGRAELELLDPGRFRARRARRELRSRRPAR
jgi:glycine/D-amino acid oxidase-like deaminating enzyme